MFYQYFSKDRALNLKRHNLLNYYIRSNSSGIYIGVYFYLLSGQLRVRREANLICIMPIHIKDVHLNKYTLYTIWTWYAYHIDCNSFFFLK